MGDMTLNEYKDFPEEELRRILQAEREKMFGYDDIGQDTEGVTGQSYPPHKDKGTSSMFRYWIGMAHFITSNKQKASSSAARICS